MLDGMMEGKTNVCTEELDAEMLDGIEDEEVCLIKDIVWVRDEEGDLTAELGVEDVEDCSITEELD